jgi:hypothetical protein
MEVIVVTAMLIVSLWVGLGGSVLMLWALLFWMTQHVARNTLAASK